MHSWPFLLVLVPATVLGNSLKDELLSQTSSPTLVRVVVLARHGSKVPDPLILGACPAFTKTQGEFMSELQSSPNELTPHGFQQLYDAGQFARKRYVDGLRVLAPSFYLNKSSTFSSQRSAFCLQSSTAFAKGLFPDGTGPPGFLDRPQIVPINVPYGLAGEDVLFNCRDGPCAGVWNEGKAEYTTGATLDSFKEKNKGALEELTKTCGAYDYSTNPSVLDQIKFLDDDLTWAAESGLSSDLDGKMSEELLEKLHVMGYDVVKNVYVGFGKQLAVTACGFPARLLQLLDAPNKGDFTFDFFLNHREMLYGTLEAFFVQEFQLPGHFPGYVLTGSAIFFELHEDKDGKFIRMYLFVAEAGGQVLQLIPKSCNADRCALETFADNFAQFVRKNGDINKMCAHSGTAMTETLAEVPSTPSTPDLGNLGVVMAFVGSCVGAFFMGRMQTALVRTSGGVVPLLHDSQ